MFLKKEIWALNRLSLWTRIMTCFSLDKKRKQGNDLQSVEMSQARKAGEKFVKDYKDFLLVKYFLELIVLKNNSDL